MKCGRITKEQLLKSQRAARREADLMDGNGFIGTHKVHKSKKTYSRKQKHKGKDY
jgi:hypothetical protein